MPRGRIVIRPYNFEYLYKVVIIETASFLINIHIRLLMYTLIIFMALTP